MRRVLVVEHEEQIAALLHESLTVAGCVVEVLADAGAAADRVRAEDFDLVIVDLQLPGDGALHVVRALHEADVDTSVVVVARREDVRHGLVLPDSGPSSAAGQRNPRSVDSA